MRYHIFCADDVRITVDDEKEETEGLCVTLVDGEILWDEDDEEFDHERLDVPAMDATFAAFVAKHDLSDPDQRMHLRRTFENTKAHAEAKVADHSSMRDLSEKYLEIIAKAEKKRHLQ